MTLSKSRKNRPFFPITPRGLLPPIRRRRLMRNRTDQRGSSDSWLGLLAPRGNLGWQVVLIEDCAHLIVRDADRDVFIEGNGIVAPIFVKDVEAQDFPVDHEIVERGHRIGIVTAAADHASKLAPHLLDDEVLLVDADTKADPRARDLVGRELQPRAGRGIATSASTATGTAARSRRGWSRTTSWSRIVRSTRRRRSSSTSRSGRASSSKDGDITRGQHDNRNRKWVGSAFVLDHHPPEIPAFSSSEFARDDQVGFLKDGSACVGMGGLAVVVDMCDREVDTRRAELTIDERQRRGIVTPGAVDAAHGGASNRELVDAGRPIGFRFPASPIVVGILSESGGNERENNADNQR